MGENPTAHEAAENTRRSSVMCRLEKEQKKNSGGEGCRGEERGERGNRMLGKQNEKGREGRGGVARDGNGRTGSGD